MNTNESYFNYPSSLINADILSNIRYSRKAYLESKNKPIDNKLIADAILFIEDISGISLNETQMQDLFDLYPWVRIEVITFGIEDDLSVKNKIATMIANFFLGRKWPTYWDKDSEIKAFVALLRQQATHMGYKLVKNWSCAQRLI